MTQALAAFTSEGIIMASDSRATRIDAAGQMLYFAVDKLFPLGQYAGVVSGGSGHSIPLTHALRQSVAQERLVAIEDIVAHAVPFLSQGYGRYLEQHGPEPQAEFRRLNFILAGYSLEQADHPYQIYLLESENNELPFRLHPVNPLVVMPRNLSMEMRLFKALQQNTPLDQLLEMSKAFLVKVSSVQPGIGPPFVFATITRAGFHPVSL